MSNNDKQLLTLEDKQKLETELDFLINVRRPEIIKQIQDARDQGDLSENADYDAAKNEQGRIEEQIQKIKHVLENSTIIDSSTIDVNVVSIGCTVTVFDYQDNKEYSFTIVGSEGSDPENFKISNESPLAKSIIGLKKGDTVEVKGIEKPYRVKIEKIKK